MSRRLSVSLAVALSLVIGGARGEGPNDQELAFFETKIRPVLVEHCYECHSVEAGKSKGGLLLDSRVSIREGGDSGPAIVPREPENSLLFAAISHGDPDLEMPPKKPKLPDAVIADIEAWIRSGAPDPREERARVERAPVDIASGRKFWAFRKPLSVKPPPAGDPEWAKGAVDEFVLATLEREGLEPAPDAEPRVLLRRLHFDLAGLPPSVEAIDDFIARVDDEGFDAALAREVDALLASERFGERWGRHWLDVARFAESSGKESNLTFPHAWRYRDYVIDSFNADKPFSRFVVEQVAGDLLPFDSDEERAELLVATGFLALGPKGLNEMNREQFFADLADEQIDTVSRATMAMSVACARCHDHKFDPFRMEDYYALAGIFASTETFYGTWIGSENVIGGDLITLPAVEGQLIPNKSLPKEKVEALKAKLAALNEEERAGKEAVHLAMRGGRNPGDAFTLADALRIIWQRGGVEGQLETVDEEGNALPLCMGVQDAGKVVNLPLLERGELDQPGEVVRRGFPRVILLDGLSSPPVHESGRVEFAEWLTHPAHPLTARVWANRAWVWMFGEGIVRTPDNFGYNGERPTHPELLDYLATFLVENEWSTKALVREIALSRTYRQSSESREDQFRKDPENRFFWRSNKRRVDAESLRDAMLAVSGNLDTSRRPGSLIAEVGDKSVSLFGFTKSIPRDLDGCHYRSVYLPVVRDRMPDVLELFDSAEPSLVTGRRETTNVPLQSLYLLNSPFVREQSSDLAQRVYHGGDGFLERIEKAFKLCYGREPDNEEMNLSRSFFVDKSDPGGDGPKEWEAMTNFCQALLTAAEFRNLD